MGVSNGKRARVRTRTEENIQTADKGPLVDILRELQRTERQPPNDLQLVSENELISLRARVETEMRRRKISLSVGDIGEQLVIDYFNATAGLPNLLRAPRGTKNVDALSRNGDRYSIKTIWKAKKTGTVYPDFNDKEKQLFEFMLIVQITDEWQVQSIFQLTWKEFVSMRLWDRRMQAWYIGCSARLFKRIKKISSGSFDA